MKNKLDLGIPRKHVRLFNRTLKERMESEKKKNYIEWDKNKGFQEYGRR